MTRVSEQRGRGGVGGWAPAAALCLAVVCGVAPAAAQPEAVSELPIPLAQASGEEELREALALLDRRAFDLERELGAAKLDLAAAERRWNEDQARAEAAPEPDGRADERAAAARLAYESKLREVALLGEQLARIEVERETWQRLRALARGGVERAALTEWRLEAAAQLELVEREQRTRSGRLEELRQQLERTRTRLEEARVGDPSLRWLAREAATLEGLIGRYESGLASLEALGGLSIRLETELAQATGALGFGDWLRVGLERLRTFWNFELAAPDDQPITPGKIFTALVAFGLLWLAARIIARLLGLRVFPRMGFDEGATAAFQALAFYFLMVVAFMVALQLVNIPLTTFAVVGGALAIGIGFGSQNVVSNFISGLILLAERPIKIGDLVEVEGIYGTVERIGLRSTRVRSGNNIHVIVPNASFLEKKVVNWTHSDARVRVQVSVGVIYGSPTREVERLLRQALSENEKVLRQPEPIVLFSDFGDNALGFEVHFWVQIRSQMERLQIESDLRFRIDDLFRGAGLVIAFPQRDVHLDTTSPLEVRVLPPGAPGQAGGG